MFSVHKGMLSGQERKLNFLGAKGPTDNCSNRQTKEENLAQASLPATKKLTGKETTCSPVLRSPDCSAHMAQEA